MHSGHFPFSTPESRAVFNPRRWRSILRSNGTLKFRFFATAFLLTGLIVYLSPNTPSRRFPVWYLPSKIEPHSVKLLTFTIPALTTHLAFAVLAGIRCPDSRTDQGYRTPTRGFFSRDYSLGLGWNNVRYIIEAALLQAELLNRTLVLPSFVYARACEYNITVCADYATMVNKGDAIGSNEWRELPIEEQMGFRIPISVIVNMTNLRNQQPVITASEYLRLHGQDPECESSSGFWPRQWYHTHPSVFEANKTRTPSLFVIENHWYGPEGTTRVDYIPEAMKKRGNLDRYPGWTNTTEYWSIVEPTQLSRDLHETMLSRGSSLDWYTTKDVLMNSRDLIGNVNLDNDQVVEELLNAHDWEVLHTFPAVLGMEYAKIVVGHLKVVVPRSSIRGFKDDYHAVDADVVVLAGETHRDTKAGAMLFTEELSRKRYASKVVHSLVPPQKFLDLAESLSSRMRLLTEGRMWMGTHMRRGDFIRVGLVMEMNPEAHIQRVKERLQAGHTILVDLYDRANWTTWDIDGTQPDLEQITLPPPRAEDPFFVATDERDPDTLRKFASAGAVFISDLLTMEDRQSFGWPLMFMDLMAIVELQLLVRSGYFYGHCMSSFAGVVMNMRAGRGADPRTTLLD
ncbi:hypothetical protein EI94DRAFT_1583000 [Lactarius quietus]|nr:hypothetical protein EI94DRAFT_1583000 [Lactarius quietus]